MLNLIRTLIWALSFPSLVILHILTNMNLRFYAKKLKINKGPRDPINYIYINTESPEYLRKSHYQKYFEDLDVISPKAIYQNSTTKLVRHVNISFMYSLSDRFCSFNHFTEKQKEEIWLSKNSKTLVLRTSKIALDGHKLRNETFNILSSFPDHYDCIDLSKQPIKDLSVLFQKYKSCVVVENTIHKEYVSEKFFDPIKYLCVPIYAGGDITPFSSIPFDTINLRKSDPKNCYGHDTPNNLNDENLQQMAKKNYDCLVDLRTSLEDEFIRSQIFTYFSSKGVHKRSAFGRLYSKIRAL